MTSVPPDLRAALADRYILEGIVGEGGMATVYRARDRKHDREVAVKVLRPELSASIGSHRFLKEVEIAARLSHPHIVPLFDSGDAAGFLYYVMPYVRGRSLRGVLRQEGTLPLSTAVDITRQVAAGLTHAHRSGVLHRDIKPENILLADSHAFVVDFGVAKALDQAAGATLTRTGFALGTPGYMSPEQAAGVRSIDVRADVYGLACVVYEMLIGEPPGLWLTETAARVGRFVDAEPSHRERLDRLPARVEQALARALAMRPSDRFPSIAGFMDALDAGGAGAGPRYGSDEIREIIGLAARVEAAQVTRETLMSIGGIERLAAEVGIAPVYIRRALEELDLEPAVPPAGRLPAPVETAPPPTPAVPEGASTVHVERVVDRELPLRATGPLVDLLAEHLGPGRTTIWEGTLTWTPVGVPGQAVRHVRVTLTPARGRTRIRIDEQVEQVAGQAFGAVAGACFGGLFGLTLGGGLSGGEPSVVSLFGLLGTVGGAFTVSRSLGVHATMRRERQHEALAGRLAGQVRRLTANPVQIPPPSAPV
jgi:serine/threonine-protein kinase